MRIERLEKAIPKINAVLDGLIDVIEEKRRGGEVDVQDLCLRLSIDIIGKVLLDTNLGGLDGSRHLYEAITDVGRIVSHIYEDPIKRVKLSPSPDKAQQNRRDPINRMSTEFKSVTQIVMAKEDPEDGDEPMWYMLKSMIDADTRAPLSDKGLTREIATIVKAGMYATGHQLAWILTYLAAHDKVVDRLVKEMGDYGISGPRSADVDMRVLTEMPYLNAVIEEGMRMAHIFVTHTSRVATHDTVIMGYRIPKGTHLCVPGNRWIGADEDWSDPGVFRPERWLTGEDLSRKRYFPFSYGPRDCAGQKLAMLEMRMAIIRLIIRYRFRLKKPLSELTRKTRSGISTEAIGGIWMELSPRTVSAWVPSVFMLSKS